MSHFAKIENGIVTQVIVAEQDFVDTQEGTWVQTSYNTHGGQHKLGGSPLRKNYAGIGYVYDSTRDAFYNPQPYPSWILNETTCIWEAPNQPPENVCEVGINGQSFEVVWVWDEASTSWVR